MSGRASALKYAVKRFKNLKHALKELEPFIRNGKHLQYGRPFKRFGGMRSRDPHEPSGGSAGARIPFRDAIDVLAVLHEMPANHPNRSKVRRGQAKDFDSWRVNDFSDG
jgi:hypothetical protein